MERRQHKRLDLSLTCHVRSASDQSLDAVMTTQNIGRSGLLLRWPTETHGDKLPRNGDRLMVDIELPMQPEYGPRCIHCEGTVVRVEDSSLASVALRIDRMEFQRYAAGSEHLIEFNDVCMTLRM
jgi:hypothetical protein